MKPPRGAITSFEDVESAMKQGPVYISTASSSSTSEILKVGKLRRATASTFEVYPPDGTAFFRGRTTGMRIPLRNFDGRFFTNYWLAYAHSLTVDQDE